jgi:hypothetical protein
MTVPVFEHLLSLVSQKISRGKRSDGICAQQRLAIKVRFLFIVGWMN